MTGTHKLLVVQILLVGSGPTRGGGGQTGGAPGPSAK